MAAASAAADSAFVASIALDVVLMLLWRSIFLAKDFLELVAQVAKWDEQREAGFFPGPL